MKINPMETAPFEHEDFDEAPSNIFVHKGAWATIIGTNDKLAGWVDTHELFADHLYRDQILTKQYTNTREPGEFGDGVTVEKMTDEELVEKLRTVNIATAPYACPEAVDWCHEAADRLEALTAALPHMGGVSEEMLIAAFLRGESWRKRNDVDRYVAVPEMAEKAARDYADAILSVLSSHEPAPTDTQEALSEAGEVVAWVIPGQDNANDRGFIDAMAWKEVEFTVPLVRLSALTACQQEVERLRKRESEWAAAASYGDGSPMFTPDRLEQSIASMLSRNAELVKALEPFADLANSVFRIDDGREMNACRADNDAVWGFDRVEITYGDLRRARAALNGEPQK